MKFPNIRLKKTLEVTMKDAIKRLDILEGSEKKALRDEYREWIEASDTKNEQPHVLYANQINFESL